MRIFWFLQGSDDYFSARETRAATAGARTILLLLLLTLSSFGAWAYYAEIDQITRAPGKVIASSKTQVVQSQEGGVLKELRVKAGDSVAKGDTVAILEPTQSETSYLEVLAKQAGLQAAITRLRTEIFGGELAFDDLVQQYPQFVETQTELYTKRTEALAEELGAIDRMLGLVSEELALNRPLIALGDVSRSDILRLERQMADLESQKTNAKNQYFRDSQAELSKLEEELASVLQQVTQRKDRLEQTVLYAPANGVVKNIAITTEGGVVKPGESVMEIVPVDDVLIVEAKVSPADIAFVSRGLAATVKIDAYDYTIYGDLDGVLTYISADTLVEDVQKEEEPYYRIQVETKGKRFSGQVKKELEILPGMTAMVEIKTGKNTVLSYLTKPLVKTISESLGER